MRFLNLWLGQMSEAILVIHFILLTCWCSTDFMQYTTCSRKITGMDHCYSNRLHMIMLITISVLAVYRIRSIRLNLFALCLSNATDISSRASLILAVMPCKIIPLWVLTRTSKSFYNPSHVVEEKLYEVARFMHHERDCFRKMNFTLQPILFL